MGLEWKFTQPYELMKKKNQRHPPTKSSSTSNPNQNITTLNPQKVLKSNNMDYLLNLPQFENDQQISLIA